MTIIRNTLYFDVAAARLSDYVFPDSRLPSVRAARLTSDSSEAILHFQGMHIRERH